MGRCRAGDGFHLLASPRAWFWRGRSAVGRSGRAQPGGMVSLLKSYRFFTVHAFQQLRFPLSLPAPRAVRLSPGIREGRESTGAFLAGAGLAVFLRLVASRLSSPAAGLGWHQLCFRPVDSAADGRPATAAPRCRGHRQSRPVRLFQVQRFSRRRVFAAVGQFADRARPGAAAGHLIFHLSDHRLPGGRQPG